MSAKVAIIQDGVGYRWHTKPIALPESFTAVMRDLGGIGFGFGGLVPPSVGTVRGFEFRRRRRGTEVWLWFSGGAGINLSSQHDIWPVSFETARAWSLGFARQHGFEPRQIRPRRGQGAWRIDAPIVPIVAAKAAK